MIETGGKRTAKGTVRVASLILSVCLSVSLVWPKAFDGITSPVAAAAVTDSRAHLYSSHR